MEVLLESEEQMGRNKQKGRGKRQRPNGPSGTLTSRRGRPDGTTVGRARGGVAGTPGDRSGELRRRGARSSRPSPAAGRSVRRRAVGQGQRAPRDGPPHRQSDRPRRRSRSARLKKKTPPGGPPSGGPGDHGDDAVLLASWAHRQGTRPRGKRALPGTGGLSDQRGFQPQRPSRSGPPGRSVADRTGARASWLGGAWNWTRKRCGESPANWERRCWRPAPATCSGSVAGELPAGNEFAGKQRRGRDRRRPGPGANRRRDDLASAASGNGGSSGSSGASPRWSSCSRSMRRGGWSRGADRSSTARCRARMR